MATYATVNPATGETLEEFPTLDGQGVQDALARSHAAFSTWRAVSPEDRSAVLSKVAAAYSEREDELARKVLIKHLQSGNSYGILLKEQHAGGGPESQGQPLG